MNCKDFQNKIVFYLDREIDKVNSAKFKSHLENCSNCKELFEQVSSSYNLINEDKISESNPFFYSRVMATIENEKQKSSFSLFTPKKLALQLATIVVGFFAISAGYFIANDKNYIEQKSLQNQYEVSDEELFADSHYLSLSSDDLYVINTQETLIEGTETEN